MNYRIKNYIEEHSGKLAQVTIWPKNLNFSKFAIIWDTHRLVMVFTKFNHAFKDFCGIFRFATCEDNENSLTFQ